MLAELTVQLLQARGYSVVERSLPANWMVRQALEAGNVHLAWQESAHVWHVTLGHDLPIRSESELLRRVKTEDRLKSIMWLNPLPWSARMAVIIRAEDAAARNLASIPDLAHYISRVDPNPVLCVPEELYDTTHGIRGLERVYQVRFKREHVRFMSHSDAYQALVEKDCDVALGYAKDVTPYGGELVSLRDAKAFFPASSTVPTIHMSALQEYPELERIMAELTDALTQHRLADMERQFASGDDTRTRLATRFLRESGLVSAR